MLEGWPMPGGTAGLSWWGRIPGWSSTGPIIRLRQKGCGSLWITISDRTMWYMWWGYWPIRIMSRWCPSPTAPRSRSLRWRPTAPEPFLPMPWRRWSGSRGGRRRRRTPMRKRPVRRWRQQAGMGWSLSLDRWPFCMNCRIFWRNWRKKSVSGRRMAVK